MKLAKRLKKEKVNVDIINFGEEVRLLPCFWHKIQARILYPFQPGALTQACEDRNSSLSLGLFNSCPSKNANVESNVSLWEDTSPISLQASLNAFRPDGYSGALGSLIVWRDAGCAEQPAIPLAEPRKEPGEALVPAFLFGPRKPTRTS